MLLINPHGGRLYGLTIRTSHNMNYYEGYS